MLQTLVPRQLDFVGGKFGYLPAKTTPDMLAVRAKYNAKHYRDQQRRFEKRNYFQLRDKLQKANRVKPTVEHYNQAAKISERPYTIPQSHVDEFLKESKSFTNKVQSGKSIIQEKPMVPVKGFNYTKAAGTAAGVAAVGVSVYAAVNASKNARKRVNAPVSASEIDAYNRPALQKRKNQAFRNFVIGAETGVGGLISTGLGFGGSVLGYETGGIGGAIAGGVAGDVIGKKLVEDKIKKDLLKNATPYEREMISSEHFTNTQDIIRGVGTTAAGFLLANPYLVASGGSKLYSAVLARINEKKRKRKVKEYIESQKKKAVVEPPAVEKKTTAPAAAEPATAAVDPRLVPGTERGYLLK